MRSTPGRALAAALWIVAAAACSGEATAVVVQPGPLGTPPGPSFIDAGTVGPRLPGPRLKEPVRPANPLPPLVRFQPAFHQALRWSFRVPGPVTLRYRVPVLKTGRRIRVAFSAGDGPLHLFAATVARAGTGGHLAGPPVALAFGGGAGAELATRERAVSDPLDFEVAAGDELYVSFYVDGHLAQSAIDAFPESFIGWGDQVFESAMHDHAPKRALAGLDTVDVEGPPSRAFVALGDSITEGFVSGADDTRRAWPQVMSRTLGLPVVNGAVSGQGMYGADLYLPGEVFVLEGITDCAVLLGTNDLAAKPAAELISDLASLFDRLRPWCQVWAGTLLPREQDDAAPLPEVRARRAEVNDWIRAGADVHGVIDFDRAVRDPADPERFAPGLGEDGIHPSVAGQRVMGEAAAEAVSAQE